jgi:hypothetical protein
MRRRVQVLDLAARRGLQLGGGVEQSEFQAGRAKPNKEGIKQ